MRLPQRSDRRLPWVAGVAVLVGVLLAASAAGADPTIREKRSQAALILAQVQALDEEVGAAAERFNGANYELGRLTDRLRTTRSDLRRARQQLGTARGRASQRLVQLYVNGSGPSTFEILLGTANLREMLDMFEANERILEQDTRIIGSVKRVAARTKHRELQLAASRAAQGRLVRQLESERDAIGAKLRERQELLGSIRAEVVALEVRERARQVELRQRAEAELARQRVLAAAQQSRRAESDAPPASIPAVTTPVASPAFEPTPAAPMAADASRGAQVVSIAMRYLGVPYKWGGASPSTGFDCSGFTMYVFAQIGVSLPHYAAAQYALGRDVPKSDLQPGDLVFFRGLGHMGMYIGGGNFIHSPRTGDVVKISSLSEPYRVANWVGARRVL
jgi:cell wall-associated NlpC family hydrolase